MAIENVVSLNRETVYDYVETFLDTRKSENTKKSYRKTISDFFMFMVGKPISLLIEDDLKYKYKDILKYQKHLQKKYSNKSVNQKMNAIRSLFNYLAKNEFDVKTIVFEVEGLSEHDSKTIGFFKSYDEAMLMVGRAKELFHGEMKSTLLDLAVHTSIRLSALLKLRPIDFKQIDDTKWEVKAIDKRNKPVKKAIRVELYERVQALMFGKKRYDKIFNIGARQITNDIQKLCEMMNIDPERNISFHSFRKVAAMYEITENGDIVAAARALNHSGIQTCYKYYTDHTRDYDSEASITMGQEEDMSCIENAIENMSKDELKKLIRGCNKRTIRELNEKCTGIME